MTGIHSSITAKTSFVLVLALLVVTGCWFERAQTNLDSKSEIASVSRETAVLISGVISLTISPGTFPKDHTVRIDKTREKETAEDFTVSIAMYPNVIERAPYEIRINTGKVAPTKAMVVELATPKELMKETSFAAFVQFFYDGENETLDQFELVDSTYDGIKKTVRLKLEPSAFTNLRNADSSFEAVIVVAVTKLRKAPEGAQKADVKQ